MSDYTEEETNKARALCSASGFDPDALMTFGPSPMGPKGWYYVPCPDLCRPAWTLFVLDLRAARAFIESWPGVRSAE